MKDIIKGVVLFCIFYVLWNVFWRGVFFAWDLLGFTGSAVAVGIIYGLYQKLFGEVASRREMPPKPEHPSIEVPSGTTKRSGLLSQRSPDPEADTVAPDSATYRASPQQEANVSTETGEGYVTMFSRIQELDSKCSAVWQRGLDERREYRRLRRQSMESARDFLEKCREASVKTDEESLVAEIDSFLDELSAVYLAGTTEQRGTIRSIIEGYKRLLGNIHSYVGRCAIRLRQAPSPEFLLRGLAAASIDDNHSAQDYEHVLGMLYLAAAEAGIDPSPHFKVVADLSGSEPDSMGATLEEFDRSRYFELTVKPQLPKQRNRI